MAATKAIADAANAQANTNKGDIATINETLSKLDDTYATDAELEEVSDALAGAKTELQGNIDGVAGRVTTAEGKITTIENTLNDEASGLAATKAIADEAKAAASTNATAIGSLEDAVNALEDAVDVIEADYIRVDKATNQMFVGADVIIFDCGGVE